MEDLVGKGQGGGKEKGKTIEFIVYKSSFKKN